MYRDAFGFADIIGGNWTSESRYDHLDLQKSSVLNFQRLDKLWAAIGHPIQKIWPFKFAESFHFHVQKLINFGRPSDIRVKRYGRLNLPRASVFKFKHLDISWEAIRHSSQNIWTFEFAQSFRFQSLASQYITGDNCTLESKDMDVWIWLELPFSISSVSIYNGRQSAIWVKRYGCLNLPRGSIFNLKHLDTLLVANRHPNQDMTLWICLNLPF